MYRSGVLVQIPRPERYAIHKFIVADRRTAGPERLKAVKDRALAELLIDVLSEQRPDELARTYMPARNVGPKRRHRLDATLTRMPEGREKMNQLA